MEYASAQFIELASGSVAALLLIGFVGGLVSGFIGSGGAFVLTPAMMSMGVPGVIAVASNMCHKFPKALVGACRRAKYGHVDVKLGLVIAASAAVGVWVGADIQQRINASFGEAGSNLYVSLAFVVVLTIVGGYVLLDAVKIYRSGRTHLEEKPSRLARWVQSVEIPGTMMHFKTAGIRISALFTIPLGFATGMLAATIAVGGFIGVPGMIYVLGAPALIASATELVIAFVMGLGGSIKYALHGLVDIRLALILLAGSLFGVQLGAIGTTYVRPYVIRVVMAAIMLIVAVSRGLVVPVYLAQLDMVDLSPGTMVGLRSASFVFLVAALGVGAFIILGAMLRGHRAVVLKRQQTAAGE
ncbi:MAG: sulfite exporter TauE/SafE family protein [Betaproteobacteria bacterium]|nr:sulfite exporter TauE/SafE family protein [Betaproteobacteria bacterium]